MVVVLLAATVLALAHLAVGRIQPHSIPRIYWRSAAGGVAVAYVFVHVLPELAARQRRLDDQLAGIGSEYLIFLVGLAGFVVFYGVEHLARIEEHEPAHEHALWLHIGSFGLYNAFIGYLLHDQYAEGVGELLTFTVALGLHLAVNEYALQYHHETLYQGRGQLLLAMAVVAGALAGYVFDLSFLVRSGLFAFLGGGIMLNAIKEELPDEQRGRVVTFTAGAGLYALFELVV